MTKIWSLQFLPATRDDLDVLDKRIVQNITKRLEWLVTNFDRVFHGRLSAEFQDCYKLRAGDYRVIYQFNPQTKIILVLRIGHRSKIYKYRQ